MKKRTLVILLSVVFFGIIGSGVYYYFSQKPDKKVESVENLAETSVTIGENMVYEGEICDLLPKTEALKLLNAKELEQDVSEDVCSYVMDEPLTVLTFKLEDISETGVQAYIDTLEYIEGDDLVLVDAEGVDVAYWANSSFTLHAIRGESVVVISMVQVDEDNDEQLDSVLSVLNSVLSRID